MTVVYVLIALLVFGAILFVHELGHYVTARLFHVTVKEFSIGMGPALFRYRSKKTGILYALRLFPIGGYVSMAGEDEESDDENALSKKAPWKRLIITAAGATMNLLTGFLLTVLLVSTMTIGSTTVADFRESDGVSSADSGLMAGDTILSVNGKQTYIPEEVYYTVLHDGYRPIDVTVLRDGETITLSVTFPTQTTDDGTLYGLPDTVFYAKSGDFFERIRYAWHYTGMAVRMVWESFFDLITGRVSPSAVSGPVGITSEMTEAAQSGDYRNLLYIAMLISVNVGIFNLFPLPALDGGRLMFILWEMVTKKPVPAQAEGLIHGIGLFLLLILSAVIMFKDVLGLLG